MEPITVCAANGYSEKYYINPAFDKIPEDVKNELKIICVLFTEEVGGIIQIGFDEDGELMITTKGDDSDYYYDDIAAGMLVARIREKRQDLFESLHLYYRVFILHERLEDID